MLKYEIVKLATTKILTISISKKLLQVTITNTAKYIKVGRKKTISLKFVSPSQTKSNSNIFILTTDWQQKLICQISILKYLGGSIEEYTNDNLLGDNNPVYIDSNINMDIKVSFNSDKDITGSNLHKKNSEINNDDIF